MHASTSRRLWIAALLIATFSASIAVAAEDTASLEQRIDAYLAPFADAGHLSGSILVATAGEVLYEKSFGMANREHSVPVDAETRFCVASITKPMTQIIALRLMAAGKLALADPVSKWIADFPRGDEISVEMLMRHQAGIPHRLTTDLEEAAPRTAADMVELAKKQALTFEPASDSSYSSGGYSVMARILELAAGKSYGELLGEHVFGPAGMTDSQHPEGNDLIANRASSYQFSNSGQLVNSALRNYSFLVGAGSVFSTPRDLVRLMQSAVVGAFGPGVSEVLLRNGDITWNGRTDGYRAFADYHAEPGFYVAFASNILTGAGDLIRRDLPKLVAGESVARPTVPRHELVTVDAETLASYEGDYELRPGSVLTLSVDGDAVSMSGWLLIPTSETTFFSPQDYGEIAVVRRDDGSIERLDWTVGGQTYPMPRVEGSED